MRGMVKVTSLGCAKNFVDTEVASASFLCAGFGLTSSDQDADILILNYDVIILRNDRHYHTAYK